MGFAIHLRDVEIHILVTLTPGGRLEIARSSALDLHTAACFLLNVFHISATMANDLCAKIETRY